MKVTKVNIHFEILYFVGWLATWGWLNANNIHGHWYWFITWPYELAKFLATQHGCGVK